MNGLKIGIGVLAVGGLAVTWAVYDRSSGGRRSHSAGSREGIDSGERRASEPPVEPAKCDIVAQTGCGPGERCDYQCVDKTTQLGCFPDVGSGDIGNACNAESPCRKGLYCASQTGCNAYCKTDADCPDDMACRQGLLTFCGPSIGAKMCFKPEAEPK